MTLEAAYVHSASFNNKINISSKKPVDREEKSRRLGDKEIFDFLSYLKLDSPTYQII